MYFRSQVDVTDVSEVRTVSIIALMMEAVCTSETSVSIYLTIRQYIPEDSKLQRKEVFYFYLSIKWIFLLAAGMSVFQSKTFLRLLVRMACEI
jgi:hypothetical protein